LAGQSTPVLLENPQSAVVERSHRPLVMVHGNVVAVGPSPAALARVASIADSGARGGFSATPLGARVAQSYQTGAGWLFAANMEQIVAHHVPKSDTVTNPANIAGLNNIRFLVIERK